MNPARLLFPALRWSPDAARYEPEGGGLEEALAAGVGGFILFGGTAEAAERLTAQLRERAGRELLIGADLERGAGQQFAGLTEWPPPAALAATGLDAVRAAAASTAAEARQVGVNWVFAPVADLDLEPANPIVQTRSFGADAARVAECVSTWVGACRAAGALPCAKHFPGHGRTRRDSHETVPVVDVPRGELERDLAPFRAAIASGVPTIMTAHVRYHALDPHRPATASAAILDLLRTELGFAGATVTDALIMAGASGLSAADIVESGVDALLYPQSVHAALGELEAGRVGGALAEERLAQAIARLDGLRAAVPPSTTADRAMGPAEACDDLLAAPPLRGTLPDLRGPLELVVVDDDLGGPYPPTPSDWCTRALGPAAAGGGSRVILLLAEPRGWKGRAGLSEAARTRLAMEAPAASLVVLFGHPRLVDEVPGQVAVLGAWHRARPLQEAVARRLRGLLA